MGLRGTLPPLDTIGAAAAAPAVASLPALDHVVFVDTAPVTGAEDGTIQNPYHTIANGLIAAAALTPTAINPVVIYVFPGRYDEDGLSSVDYVRIVGVSRRAVRIYSDAQLLSVDDTFTSYWNLTFEVTDEVVSVEVDAAAGNRIEFHDCGFIHATGAGSYVDVINSSNVLFKDCVFELTGNATSAIRTNGTLPTVEMESCRVTGNVLQVEGSFNIQNCRIIGGITQTTDPVDLIVEHCHITSDGHCIALSAAGATVIIRHNILEADDGSFDVHTGVGVFDMALIQNNIMKEGIHQLVGVLGGTVYVGKEGDRDYYKTIYDAVQYNPNTRNLVVEVLTDVVETLTATIEAEKVTVRLNGHKVSRATRQEILRTQAGAELVIEGPGEVEATVTQASSGILRLKDVHLDGQIYAESNATGIVEVDSCRVYPEGTVSWNAAILIFNTSTTFYLKHSYFKGQNSGFKTALFWRNSTNDNVYARHCTFVNGDEAATAFGRSHAQTPNIVLHNCAHVVALPVWLTNLIAAGQQFITVDGNVVFD